MGKYREKTSYSGRFVHTVGVCAAMGLMGFWAGAGEGAAIYWDGNGTDSGAGANTSGAWETSASWTADADGLSATGTYVDGSDVHFAAGNDSLTAALTIGVNVAANSVWLDEGATTLTFSTSSRTITVGSGGVHVASGASAIVADATTSRIGFTVNTAQTWSAAGSSSLLVGKGEINALLTLGGTGTIQLGNTGQNNGFDGSGGVKLDGATLILSTSSSGLGTNTLELHSGHLQAGNSSKTLNNTALNVTGSVYFDGSHNQHTYNGGTTITGNQTVTFNTNTNFNYNTGAQLASSITLLLLGDLETAGSATATFGSYRVSGVNVYNNGGITIGGGVAGTNRILTGNANNTNIAGPLTGTAANQSLTLKGSKITLNGLSDGANTPALFIEGAVWANANTFTSPVTIRSGGVLKFYSSGALASHQITVQSGGSLDTSSLDSSGGFTLAAGQVLAGNGSVTGKVVLGNGAILSPGESAGTLTLTSSGTALTVNDGASLVYDIGGSDAAPLADLVNLTGSGSTVAFAGAWTLNLHLLSGATLDPTGKTFVLFDYNDVVAGLGSYSINYGNTGWTGGVVSIDSGNSRIILTGLAVPEPASSAMVCLMGLAAWGRRRVR